MTTATKAKAPGNGGNRTERVEDAAKARAEAPFPGTGFAFAPGLADLPSYEDILSFNRENLDAMLAAGNAVAKGYQDLSRAWFGLAQESVEEALNAGRALAEARTIKELVDVQSNLTRVTVERAFVESSRLQDLSVRVAEAALEPFNGRVTAAVERWSKSAA